MQKSQIVPLNAVKNARQRRAQLDTASGTSPPGGSYVINCAAAA
jgi:hypothetical protein